MPYLFFVVVALAFCRRIDSVHNDEHVTTTDLENKFFSSNRSGNLTEKGLVDYLKRQNDRLGFVDRTVQQVGFPRWNKTMEKASGSVATRLASDSGFVYYIPFVREGENFVNTCLMVDTRTSDTTFSWICDWQYQFHVKAQPAVNDSAARFAAFFMMFDRNVFGQREFSINDSRLFKSGRNVAQYVKMNTPPPDSLPANKMAPVDDCINVTVSVFIFCPYPETSECAGGCDRCFQCLSSITTEVCFTGGGGGNGAGWTPPATGGGGGGGTAPPPSAGTPPECHPAMEARCTPGWNPKPPEDKDNPCIGAKGHLKKAQTFANTPVFSTAASNMTNAATANPNREYAMSFGLNRAGEPTPSIMNSEIGNHADVPSSPNCFADLHNHRGGTEPSAGDLYGIINQNTPTNGYDIRYVTSNGTMYAFVVYDSDKADKFNRDHAPTQSTNPQTGQPYPPELPTTLLDEFRDVLDHFSGVLGYSRDLSGSMAWAFILEKYQSGIAILKRGPNEPSFKILRAKQSNSANSIPTFETVSCD